VGDDEVVGRRRDDLLSREGANDLSLWFLKEDLVGLNGFDHEHSVDDGVGDGLLGEEGDSRSEVQSKSWIVILRDESSDERVGREGDERRRRDLRCRVSKRSQGPEMLDEEEELGVGDVVGEESARVARGIVELTRFGGRREGLNLGDGLHRDLELSNDRFGDLKVLLRARETSLGS